MYIGFRKSRDKNVKLTFHKQPVCDTGRPNKVFRKNHVNINKDKCADHLITACQRVFHNDLEPKLEPQSGKSIP